MTSSNLKRKESSRKSSQRYYQKNKQTENEKAAERMRKLWFNRAVAKIMVEIKAAREGNSSTELPKESRPCTPTGDNASDAGHSERSVMPDHLRWPTPEYLRDYEWEAQMEELKKKNEEERMQAEEQEVRSLLVLDADNTGDATMDTDYMGDTDGLEYVSDSEGDLLLSPVARLRSPVQL